MYHVHARRHHQGHMLPNNNTEARHNVSSMKQGGQSHWTGSGTPYQVSPNPSFEYADATHKDSGVCQVSACLTRRPATMIARLQVRWEHIHMLIIPQHKEKTCHHRCMDGTTCTLFHPTAAVLTAATHERPSFQLHAALLRCPHWWHLLPPMTASADAATVQLRAASLTCQHIWH